MLDFSKMSGDEGDSHTSDIDTSDERVVPIRGRKRSGDREGHNCSERQRREEVSQAFTDLRTSLGDLVPQKAGRLSILNAAIRRFDSMELESHRIVSQNLSKRKKAVMKYYSLIQTRPMEASRYFETFKKVLSKSPATNLMDGFHLENLIEQYKLDMKNIKLEKIDAIFCPSLYEVKST